MFVRRSDPTTAPASERPRSLSDPAGTAPPVSRVFPVVPRGPEYFRPAPGGLLQRKTVLGAVDDPAEREADAAADRLVAGLPVDVGRGDTALRRTCAACEEEEELRRETDAAGGRVPDNPIPGPGAPLPRATRGWFEPLLGRSLEGVRVHTGAEAATAARQAGARAYTLRDHIVFGDGEFAPDTPAGRHLLGHELAHVAQQGGRNGEPAGPIRRVPCTSTARAAGNPEHEALEEHYITQVNSTGGRREYELPQSGPNGGTGWADIADVTSYAIYDYRTWLGVVTGVEKVDRYVDSARANCPGGDRWHAGIAHPAGAIPHPNLPDTEIVFRQYDGYPGVVVYWLRNRTPVPVPQEQEQGQEDEETERRSAPQEPDWHPPPLPAPSPATVFALFVLAGLAAIAAVALLPAEAAAGVAAAVVLLVVLASPSNAMAATGASGPGGVGGAGPGGASPGQGGAGGPGGTGATTPELQRLLHDNFDLIDHLADPEGTPLTPEEWRRVLSLGEQTLDALHRADPDDPYAVTMRDWLRQVQAGLPPLPPPPGGTPGATASGGTADTTPVQQGSTPPPGTAAQGSSATTPAAANGGAARDTGSGVPVLSTTSTLPASTGHHSAVLTISSITPSTPLRGGATERVMVVQPVGRDAFAVQVLVRVVSITGSTAVCSLERSWFAPSVGLGQVAPATITVNIGH